MSNLMIPSGLPSPVNLSQLASLPLSQPKQNPTRLAYVNIVDRSPEEVKRAKRSLAFFGGGCATLLGGVYSSLFSKQLAEKLKESLLKSSKHSVEAIERKISSHLLTGGLIGGLSAIGLALTTGCKNPPKQFTVDLSNADLHWVPHSATTTPFVMDELPQAIENNERPEQLALLGIPSATPVFTQIAVQASNPESTPAFTQISMPAPILDAISSTKPRVLIEEILDKPDEHLDKTSQSSDLSEPVKK